MLSISLFYGEALLIRHGTNSKYDDDNNNIIIIIIITTTTPPMPTT
jgi:hypothetical protein